jgi:hypothetical protein
MTAKDRCAVRLKKPKHMFRQWLEPKETAERVEKASRNFLYAITNFSKCYTPVLYNKLDNGAEQIPNQLVTVT